MNKAAISAKDKKKLPSMKKLLESKGFKYDSEKPDFVVSLGGDGTYLRSEHKYPGVPKLLIKDSKICKKCVGSDKETILDLLKKKVFFIEEEDKLEAKFKGNKFLAVNDIIIRNKRPNQAIRFDIHIDNNKEHEEIIGDGLIISTSFGSTAYFQSIARDTFKEGIGIAFSNPIEEYPPIYLSGYHTIKITLVRGDAEIAYDNINEIYTLKEGETISIKQAKEKAKLIKMEGFDL